MMESDIDPKAGTAVAKSAAKRPTGKGRPPLPDNTLGALSVVKADRKSTPPPKKRTERLNFRVTGDFRRAFKRASAAQDCKKVELLERIFAEWSARYPA